jgi:hypothetical protein
MKETRDAELKSFKTDIDLRAYAASIGYALDRRESWKGSSVMRNAGNRDKVIVKRDIDGNYVYFSVRDDSDNGSIIDFVQKRFGGTLGGVRITLRPWLGKRSSDIPVFPALDKTSKDRMEVETFYRKMPDAPDHPYLTKERMIPPALLASDRFAGRVRMDLKANALFPHFDEGGICGYEIKGKNYTAFSRGGEKGLWFSRTESTDDALVLAESAIDALSYAALFLAPSARYASIGGQVNQKQPGLIKAAIQKLREGSKVIAAMDGDEQGQRLAAMIEEKLKETGRSDLTFVFHPPMTLMASAVTLPNTEPVTGETLSPPGSASASSKHHSKDWNDLLRSGQAMNATILPPTALLLS